MKKGQISRVCIVDTVYTLFFYYLNYSIDEISRTFFFVSEGFPNSIKDKLPQYHFFRKRKSFFLRFLFRIRLRFFSRLQWSFLRKKPIYGLDHLTFSSGIIGKRKYILLEDAPRIASFYYNSPNYKNNLRQRSSKIVCFFIDALFGSVFFRPFGDNSQCEQIIFSTKDIVPALSEKNIQINTLEQLWENSSKEKKDLILRLFDINKEDMDFLSTKSIILFTQTYFIDNILSEEEQVGIYDEIIKRYPSEEILLKVHPRDPINYSSYFPNIAIFDKILPNQLLNLLGIKFKKAVAISSTAVLSFPYEIEIDWIGTKIHPKLLTAIGDIKLSDIKK